MTVQALRRGRPEVLADLLDRYGRDMQAVAYLIVRDRAAAEDIVADSLLAALDHGRSLRDDDALRPWLLRAMVERSRRRMVGHIGFHSRPGADYLRELSPGGVELGYVVYPAFRRRGYAREATLAMMAWAARAHGVRRFVVSISPSNVASTALAEQLGFRRIGSHVDEIDGPEDIFELLRDESV